MNGFRLTRMLALPAALALAMTACTVPDAMRVREGIHPKNQDENVRFRTTYYFRVFDACSDRDTANGKFVKGRDRIITDALYRFRMTGKANALSTQVRFESGTLRRQEIDPFGASIAFESGTGQPRFRSRQETEAVARVKIDQDHIRGLIDMKRELEAAKGKNRGEMTAMADKINEAIRALPASLTIPSSDFTDGRHGATNGRRAKGYFRFLKMPVKDQKLTVNGVDFIVKKAMFGTDVKKTVAKIATALKGSKTPKIELADYAVVGVNKISITFRTPGAAGNNFSLPKKVAGKIATSGGKLTGGVGAKAAIPATGSFRFLTKPAANDKIKLNGADFTIPARAIAADIKQTVVKIVAALKSSSEMKIIAADYLAVGDKISITFRTTGAAGNNFSLPKKVAGKIATSGTKLTGGTDIKLAIKATGSITFDGDPAAIPSIKINGEKFAISESLIVADPKDIGKTVGKIAKALNTASSEKIKSAIYTFDGVDAIRVTYRDGGVAGNVFSLPGVVKDGIDISGKTLAGGRDGGLCGDGLMARRGFQILGPEGWRTFDQDERLIMAMGTSGAPLIATLQEISAQVLDQGPNRGAVLLPLVQERLKISEAQRVLLQNGDTVDIDKIIAILEGK